LDFTTILVLLVISTILCGVGPEIVKRKSLTIRRVYLHAFHIVYCSLLIAAILLL